MQVYLHVHNLVYTVQCAVCSVQCTACLLFLSYADMENVIFFTPSQFSAKQIYLKKCVIFGNTKFGTKQQKQKNNNNKNQNHSNTVKIQYYVTKNTLYVKFLTFPRPFTTKHHVFRYKFYPNPVNFTPSRMVWMVTFSKSVLEFQVPGVWRKDDQESWVLSRRIKPNKSHYHKLMGGYL